MFVVPAQDIAGMLEAGQLKVDHPLDADQIQPASLDLRLGRTCYRMAASAIPGPARGIEDLASGPLLIDAMTLSDEGTRLEAGSTYIVECLEHLDLPPRMSAVVNPKSSSGRIDLFVRSLTDRASHFDRMPRGFKGRIYLEITPISFPVIVRPGSRLAQIRFLDAESVVWRDVMPLLADETITDLGAMREGDTVWLSAQITDSRVEPCGWRARRNCAKAIDVDKKSGCLPLDYFEPVYGERGSGGPSIILHPNDFFILASQEKVRIPELFAAEMIAFDAGIGEVRVHYAGFFDPGFGDDNGRPTAQGVLEVRGRDVPMVLENGQMIAGLKFHPMASAPRTLYGAGAGSNYQGQGLRLSKHFQPEISRAA